jgi:Endosomal/lysosomal potassium channel TMEM175
LDLRPPEIPTFKALLLVWPTSLSYAVSYLFIAIVWANDHHPMRYATTATPRLMWFISRTCFPYVALKYPLVALGACVCCLVVYLKPEAPGAA